MDGPLRVKKKDFFKNKKMMGRGLTCDQIISILRKYYKIINSRFLIWFFFCLVGFLGFWGY